MYIIGIFLSYILITRMAGKHKVFGNPNTFFDRIGFPLTFMLIFISMAWVVAIPISLSYWHIKKYAGE